MKMQYNLELDRAVAEVMKSKANTVLLQLPDGLKPQAGEIQEKIESETGATVLIWAGTCYGACDVPNVEGVDLLIQWGHSEWKS